MPAFFHLVGALARAQHQVHLSRFLSFQKVIFHIHLSSTSSVSVNVYALVPDLCDSWFKFSYLWSSFLDCLSEFASVMGEHSSSSQSTLSLLILVLLVLFNFTSITLPCLAYFFGK